MGVTSEQDRKTRTDLWLPVPSWPVSLEPPPTLLLAILDTLVLVLVLLLAPLLPTPLLSLDRPTTATPLDPLLLRTELNTESLDKEPSRPVLLPLLVLRPPAAFQRRSTSAGLVGYPPCPGS